MNNHNYYSGIGVPRPHGINHPPANSNHGGSDQQKQFFDVVLEHLKVGDEVVWNPDGQTPRMRQLDIGVIQRTMFYVNSLNEESLIALVDFHDPVPNGEVVQYGNGKRVYRRHLRAKELQRLGDFFEKINKTRTRGDIPIIPAPAPSPIRVGEKPYVIRPCILRTKDPTTHPFIKEEDLIFSFHPNSVIVRGIVKKLLLGNEEFCIGAEFENPVYPKELLHNPLCEHMRNGCEKRICIRISYLTEKIWKNEFKLYMKATHKNATLRDLMSLEEPPPPYHHAVTSSSVVPSHSNPLTPPPQYRSPIATTSGGIFSIPTPPPQSPQVVMPFPPPPPRSPASLARNQQNQQINNWARFDEGVSNNVAGSSSLSAALNSSPLMTRATSMMNLSSVNSNPSEGASTSNVRPSPSSRPNQNKPSGLIAELHQKLNIQPKQPRSPLAPPTPTVQSSENSDETLRNYSPEPSPPPSSSFKPPVGPVPVLQLPPPQRNQTSNHQVGVMSPQPTKEIPDYPSVSVSRLREQVIINSQQLNPTMIGKSKSASLVDLSSINTNTPSITNRPTPLPKPNNVRRLSKALDQALNLNPPQQNSNGTSSLSLFPSIAENVVVNETPMRPQTVFKYPPQETPVSPPPSIGSAGVSSPRRLPPLPPRPNNPTSPVLRRAEPPVETRNPLFVSSPPPTIMAPSSSFSSDPPQTELPPRRSQLYSQLEDNLSPSVNRSSTPKPTETDDTSSQYHPISRDSENNGYHPSDNSSSCGSSISEIETKEKRISRQNLPPPPPPPTVPIHEEEPLPSPPQEWITPPPAQETKGGEGGGRTLLQQIQEGVNLRHHISRRTNDSSTNYDQNGEGTNSASSEGHHQSMIKAAIQNRRTMVESEDDENNDNDDYDEDSDSWD